MDSESTVFFEYTRDPIRSSGNIWRFYNDKSFVVIDRDGLQSIFQVSHSWSFRDGELKYKISNGEWKPFCADITAAYHTAIARCVTS